LFWPAMRVERPAARMTAAIRRPSTFWLIAAADA
jgi:hypothetical protein